MDAISGFKDKVYQLTKKQYPIIQDDYVDWDNICELAEALRKENYLYYNLEIIRNGYIEARVVMNRNGRNYSIAFDSDAKIEPEDFDKFCESLLAIQEQAIKARTSFKNKTYLPANYSLLIGKKGVCSCCSKRKKITHNLPVCEDCFKQYGGTP